MNIIFFTSQLFVDGGVERTLTDKANYLVSQGHKVMFVTFMQQGRPVFYQLDQTVQHYDTDTCFHTLYRYPFYLRVFKFLKMKKNFKERLERIVSMCQPDVISISSPNTLSLLYIIESIKNSSKIVLESHMAFANHFLDRPFSERLLNYLYSPMKAVRNIDLLITLTYKDAECWRAHGVNNIKVIPNPVSFYSEKINFNNLSDRIISVGRLDSQKRFDRIIDAFSLISDKYPQWRLDICGKGQEEKSLKTQIKSLQLENRVFLIGNKKNIQPEYEHSSFLVLGSDYEGFGLVIIEAMACGIPVVATNCPYGPSEIIEDGVTGLLSNLNAADLADKMEWMITHETERREMGIKAHQAAGRYKKAVVLKEWESAYMSVLSNRESLSS